MVDPIDAEAQPVAPEFGEKDALVILRQLSLEAIIEMQRIAQRLWPVVRKGKG